MHNSKPYYLRPPLTLAIIAGSLIQGYRIRSIDVLLLTLSTIIE